MEGNKREISPSQRTALIRGCSAMQADRLMGREALWPDLIAAVALIQAV